MASGISFISIILSIVYIALAIAVAVCANRIFKSRPIGLWGDVAAATVAVAAFAFFLGNGWYRLLIELNDNYPTYFALAYMPFVAFVAIGFVRSISQIFVPAKPTLAAVAAGGAESQSAAPIAGEAAEQESPLTRRLKRGVFIVLLILAALIGAAKFITRNDLPGCSAQPTYDVLSKIYTSLKIDLKRYDEVKTNSTTDDLITCTAAITATDNAKAELDYEIRRMDGGKFEVKITNARDK